MFENISLVIDYQNELKNNIGIPECKEWCIQQNLTKDFSSIWIIYLSCFCLFLYFVMLHFRDYFTKHLEHNTYYKILQGLNRLSLYLQLGFIIYIIFFRI